MSDTENRKSMDDVLASIRRIVRAEKDPDGVQNVDGVTETSDHETAPATPDKVVAAPVDDSAPLALTPDMRMGSDAPIVDTVETAPAATPSEFTSDVTTSAYAAPEPDAIRQIVREVVLEQLGGNDADMLIRNVIRDELVSGDIGSNISQNVLRLIQTEVSKAMGK